MGCDAPNIFLSTKKNIVPPIKLDIIVFQNIPRCKKLKHKYKIGVESCHLIRYSINCFIYSSPNYKMVEDMRFELMTPCLQGRCSPAELIPQMEPDGQDFHLLSSLGLLFSPTYIIKVKHAVRVPPISAFLQYKSSTLYPRAFSITYLFLKP